MNNVNDNKALALDGPLVRCDNSQMKHGWNVFSASLASRKGRFGRGLLLQDFQYHSGTGMKNVVDKAESFTLEINGTSSTISTDLHPSL